MYTVQVQRLVHTEISYVILNIKRNVSNEIKFYYTKNCLDKMFNNNIEIHNLLQKDYSSFFLYIPVFFFFFSWCGHLNTIKHEFLCKNMYSDFKILLKLNVNKFSVFPWKITALFLYKYNKIMLHCIKIIWCLLKSQ